MKIKGEVVSTRLEEKFSSKTNRNFNIYYVTIEDEDGNTIEINCGFKQPYTQGDQVTVDYIQGNYGEYELPGKGSAPKSTGQTGSTHSSGYSRGPAKTFPLAADHPDNVIVRQNALQHASRLVAALIAAGTITATNLEIQEITKQYAMDFTRWATGREDKAKLLASVKTGTDDA